MQLVEIIGGIGEVLLHGEVDRATSLEEAEEMDGEEEGGMEEKTEDGKVIQGEEEATILTRSEVMLFEVNMQFLLSLLMTFNLF